LAHKNALWRTQGKLRGVPVVYPLRAAPAGLQPARQHSWEGEGHRFELTLAHHQKR